MQEIVLIVTMIVLTSFSGKTAMPSATDKDSVFIKKAVTQALKQKLINKKEAQYIMKTIYKDFKNLEKNK